MINNIIMIISRNKNSNDCSNNNDLKNEGKHRFEKT